MSKDSRPLVVGDTVTISGFSDAMPSVSVTSSVASSSTSTTVTHVAGPRALVVGETVTIAGHSDAMSGVSVTSSVASSSTSTTVTYVAGPRALVVGDTVTISGHAGDAANTAMNQAFTVATVNTPTEAVLTGTGMTPGTYNAGTIVAAVGDTPDQRLAMNQALYSCYCEYSNRSSIDGYRNDTRYLQCWYDCSSSSMILLQRLQ